MGRWVRERWSYVVFLVLVGGFITWLYRIPRDERMDALVVPGFLVALASAVFALLSLSTQLGRHRPERPMDMLADAVYGQWRKVALEQRLLPTPIPIRWSLSDLVVTGSVAAAVGESDQPPAFPRLPGHVRITEADLQAGGGRVELHAVYAGLASGRVMVVGAPGAGKSGTAILLLIDALAHHHDTLDDTQRARIPVPILLPAQDWDPNTRSVQDWLADHLAATYPLFARRGGRADAAALVAAADKIALILDGFDELDAGLRQDVLQALSDVPYRVVLFTRSQEMIEAASGAWLFGAVAIHLHDVPAPQAADYLQRVRTVLPPAGWTSLLIHLREHPDGVLARGLSTPLALTLLRDTYEADDDVSALLEPTRYPTTDAIKQHLITRVLRAAYTRSPGRPAPCCTEQQASQALTFIAQQMGTDRGLAWWCIPQWVPARRRILATGLVVGIVFGVVSGPLVGLGIGLLIGRVHGSGGRAPKLIRIVNWRAVITRRVFRDVLVGAFGLTLVGGFVYGPNGALVVGLFGGLAGGLTSVVDQAFIKGATSEDSPLSPREIWRSDRRAGLVGAALGFGPLYGLVVGIVGEFRGGLVVGVVDGLAYGLVVGLVLGVISSRTWATTLAWFQLRFSGRVPAVSLMPFLEDARKRDVLRIVGSVYQFRHPTLQEYLANKPLRIP